MTQLTNSAGGVVLNQQGDVLVASQRGTSWSLPKGHIEPGEDELTAARREIAEETGITDLTFVQKLGSYQRSRLHKDGTTGDEELKTITLFLFRTQQKNLAPTDTHNPEARWVPKSEVAALLTHPKDKEFFTSVLPIIV